MAIDYGSMSNEELLAAAGGKPDYASMSNDELLAIAKPATKGALPKVKNPNASWLGTNLAKGWETGRSAIGGLQRFAGDEEGGLSTIAKSKDNMAQLEADMPSMESKDVTGVGSGAKFVGELLAKNAALAVPSLAAGAGAVLAAPAELGALGLGAVYAAGTYIPNLLTETGIISADSDKVEGNRARIMKGGATAAALDSVGDAVTMGAGGITKMLRSPLKTSAVDLLGNGGKAAAKAPLAKRTAIASAKIGGAMAEEFAAEGGQSPIEKWGAGKQVFEEGKSFGDDLLGNTASALTGGFLGTTDNYTDEMQAELRESAISGAAAGLGMAGGGKALSKSVETGKDYLRDREQRILADELQKQKAEGEAAVIVAGAKEEVVAQQEATFQEAKQEQAKDLAAKLPTIKADLNNQEASFTEEKEEIVREALNNPLDDKTYAEASTVLTKGLESRGKAATEQEKEDSAEQVKNVERIVNSAKHGDPTDQSLDEALASIDPVDVKAEGAILGAMPKIEELRKKHFEKIEKEEKAEAEKAEVEAQKKQAALDTIPAHENKISTEQAKTAKVVASTTKTIDTAKAKIAELMKTKAKKGEGPAKKAAIAAQKAIIKSAEQDLATRKQEESTALGNIHENIAKATTGGTTLGSGPGQAMYEYAVAHPAFKKIARAAKNYLDYAKQMIAQFGKKIEAHLKDLWAYAKTTLQSERGSISFKDVEAEQQAHDGLGEYLGDNHSDERMPTEADYEEQAPHPAETMSFDNGDEETMSFDNSDVDDEMAAARLTKETAPRDITDLKKLKRTAPMRDNRGDRNLEPESEVEHLARIQEESDRATESYLAKPEEAYFESDGQSFSDGEQEHDVRRDHKPVARDADGNIADTRGMGIDNADPFKFVKTLGQTAQWLYNKAHPEQNVDGKPTEWNKKKELEMQAFLQEASTNNQKFITAIKKDIMANPNFRDSEDVMFERDNPDAKHQVGKGNDGSATAEYVRAELMRALKAGYDVRSLVRTAFHDQPGISFKNTKEIPSLLLEFLNKIEAPETSADSDYHGVEAMSKEELAHVKATIEKLGQEIDVDSLLNKLDVADQITFETAMYLVDLSSKMSKGDMLKNASFIKMFMQDPEAVIAVAEKVEDDYVASDIRQDFVMAFGDKAKYVQDKVLADIVERVQDFGVVPESGTVSPREAASADYDLQERADNHYGKDSTLRGVPKSRTNILRHQSGHNQASFNDALALEEEKLEHQLSFLGELNKMDKVSHGLVGTFFEATDAIMGMKGALTPANIWEQMSIVVNKTVEGSLMRKAFAEIKDVDTFVGKLLRMSEQSLTGKEHIDYAKSKEWQAGDYVTSESKERNTELPDIDMTEPGAEIDPSTAFPDSAQGIATVVDNGDPRYYNAQIAEGFFYNSTMSDIHDQAMKSPEYANSAEKINALQGEFDSLVKIGQALRREEDLQIRVKGLTALKMQGRPAQDVAALDKILKDVREELRALRFMTNGHNLGMTYKKADKAKRLLTVAKAQARVFVMKKAFRQSAMMDEKKFNELTDQYNKELPVDAGPLTAAQLYDMYLKHDADPAALLSILNAIVRDAWNTEVARAYAAARNSKDPVRDILTARLTAEEKAMYADMMSEKTAPVELSVTRPEDGNKPATTMRPVQNSFPEAVRRKLEGIAAVEARAMIPARLAEKERAAAEEKARTAPELLRAKVEKNIKAGIAAGIKLDPMAIIESFADKRTDSSVVAPADIFTEKTKQTADEQHIESKYANVKVVTVKSKIATIFFTQLAKIFNADFIAVVAGDEFSGRYIPVGVDGKAKIVVNVASSKSVTAIFAHELFHHVLNKISPEAYSQFRKAMKDAVHEDLWDKAVNRLALSMPGFEAKNYLKEIKTNEFNNHAQISMMSGGNLKFQREDLHKPAGYREKKSEGNFTTNPLNNKSSDYTDIKLRDSQRSTGNELDLSTFVAENREHIENELYAEIFAQAIHKQEFWKTLGETLEGRSLAAKALTQMAQKATEMMATIKAISPKAHNNRMVSDIVKEWGNVKGQDRWRSVRFEPREGSINSILANVIDQSFLQDTLRDGVERAYTPLDEIKDKSKLLYASGEAKLSAAYTKTLGKDSRGYRGVMTAIEKWLDAVVNWIAKHKPAGMFADFYLEEDIRALGNKIIHAGERAKQESYNRVVEKHKGAFKGMTEAQLEQLHESVFRQKDLQARAKAFHKLPEPQKAAFKAMKAVTDDLNAGLVKRGLVEADHSFVAFGQAVRLLHKDNVVDESIDASLKDAHSQIKGNPKFTQQNNSKKTLAELKQQYGMEPQTLDPMQLFMGYIAGVSQMTALHDTIKEGMAKGFVRHSFSAGMVVVDDPAFMVVNKHGGAKFRVMVGNKPLVINGKPAVFDSQETANEAMDTYKDEIATQYGEQFVGPTMEGSELSRTEALPEDERAYMNVTHYDVRTRRKTSGIDEPNAWEDVSTESFGTREEAEAHAQKTTDPMMESIIRPVFAQAEVQSASKLYFTEDFAKLMNVILSKDNLRKGEFMGLLSGEKVMKIKNGMTMLEMSFSAFHAFTIGQEAMASKAAWVKGRGGNWSLKAFNPLVIKAEAFDISALINKVITDNDYARTPEAKKEMKRLLGSDSIDAVDIYHRFFDNGGLFHMDDSIKSGMESWGEMNYKGFSGFIDDMHGTLEKQRLAHPNSPITAFSKTLLHTTMRGSSAWLMEQGIPKIKFAAFAREYSLKVEKDTARLGRELTDGEKSLLARNTIYFIEDRFGEVNWKNMWLNKSYKTALQFAFRSFTWVAGSWVALTKAGIDIAKLGWFTAKGEKYGLTERGYWGIAALAAHAMTAASVGAVYGIVSAVSGEEEEETDEATPFLTRMLFPRVDPYDNTKRIGIPSYVTEAYKIFSHLGIIGSEFEPEKLVVGRFNSLVGKTVDLIKGEDFRGVLIRNPEDSLLGQAVDVAQHMMVSPIAFSNIYKSYQANGLDPKAIPMSLLGFSDAPAFAKRSHATNLAFDLSRREYKGREMTEDEMDVKDDLKKAMTAYVRGDKSKVDELLAEGKVSERAYKIALTRYPVLNNEPNPKYKDPLSQVLGRLTVKSALKVYEEMTDAEREAHTGEMNKKLNNMRIRKDIAKDQQAKYLDKWAELQG